MDERLAIGLILIGNALALALALSVGQPGWGVLAAGCGLLALLRAQRRKARDMT